MIGRPQLREGHSPPLVSPISIKEIEKILTRELSIKSNDEYAELHGIAEAAWAIADRMLEVWSRYGNAAPDLLAALKRPIVFTVEESEDVVRLSLDGIEIAAVDFNSAAAGALLQFDAAQRAAIAKAAS